MKPMIPPKKQPPQGRIYSAPGGIGNPVAHKKWIERFIKVLRKDFGNRDPTISAILKDEKISQACATRIRAYVDKGVTKRLNAERKARGIKTKNQLKVAIKGLEAAIELLNERGDLESVQLLTKIEGKFSKALSRSKQAFSVKRHGRDRAHSSLSECQAYLRARLSQPITYATLANLVNAGFEADGKIEADAVSEEQIRKNLTRFRKNSPNWRDRLEPEFYFLNRPDTK